MSFVPGRKDCVEVRNERNVARRASAAREHKMIPEFRETRRNVFRRESERRETLRREAGELIYAVAIRGKAVDADHAFKQTHGFR